MSMRGHAGQGHKFDLSHLDRLTDPARLRLLDIPFITRRLELSEASVLIDVGTGAGIFAGAFLDFLPNAVCWCLDIRVELVDWILTHRAPGYGGRMKALCCDESSLPLEDALADLVFMVTLHHELEEPVAMLRECLRILRPGGKVLIADWKPGSRPGCPHQDRFLTATGILADLVAAGFTVAEEWQVPGDLQCFSALKSRD
jgi:SAM-dependent methyltransferase